MLQYKDLVFCGPAVAIPMSSAGLGQEDFFEKYLRRFQDPPSPRERGVSLVIGGQHSQTHQILEPNNFKGLVRGNAPIK